MTGEPLRRILRELAEADSAGLVSEARTRAHERAAKLIEDLLVEELLEAVARGRAGDPAARASARDRAEPRQSSGELWWAYCVLSASDAAVVPAELEGIEPGTGLEVVCEGDLGAVVSSVPETEYDDVRLRENLEDLSWVERTARRHEGVLEELLGQLTIVPLRLCTLYRDLDGVRRLLVQNAQELRDSLAKVDGCTEWGVKVFAGDVQVEMAVEGEPELPAEGRGAAYLLERQREREHAGRAAELRAGCAEAVHERISERARASISNPPQRPELHGRDMSMVLNGAYLVAREQEPELRETVARLQAEWASRGFVIELTGPWPPYNFASGVMP